MRKSIKLILSLLFILELLLLSSCANKILITNLKSQNNIYPMFGKTPRRSFFIPINIGDSLKLKWKSGINGSFAATSVTVLDKYVFVPDLSGRVYAFNIDNGQEIGNIRYKGTVVPAPVLNETEIIFAVSERNNIKSTLYFYNFDQGKLNNSYEIDGKIQSELIYLKNEIIYLTEDGKVGKISKDEGKLWEYKTKAYVHSSPVLVNNSVIFGNDKGEILSIDANTGKQNYRIKIGNGFGSGFTSADDSDIVYAADLTGRIFAINSKNGSIFWNQLHSSAAINTIPVLDEKFIYVNNLKGEIFKLDKATGNLIWRISTEGLINATPLVFNDYIVQPDLNKKVHFINKENGKIVRVINYENRVKLSPVFFNNILILGTDNGQIYAYEQVEY